MNRKDHLFVQLQDDVMDMSNSLQVVSLQQLEELNCLSAISLQSKRNSQLFYTDVTPKCSRFPLRRIDFLGQFLFLLNEKEVASIHQDKRSGNWIACFRWDGTQYRKSYRTDLRSTAIAVKSRVEETIRLLELGRINIPEDADVCNWIVSDGKTKQRRTSTKQVATIGSID